MSDPSEASQSPAQSIFFKKLFDMITNARHTGCIDWLPGGKSFVVLSKEDFSDHVLPTYFPQAKFTSFTRRLKRWGFKRSPETGAYHHPHFTRDMTFDLEADDEGEYPLCKALSSKALPPKKRAKYNMSPSPSPSEERALASAYASPQGSDVQVLPQLMRTINRQKRLEKRDVEEAAFPPARRVSRGTSLKKLGQGVEAAAVLPSTSTAFPPTRRVSRGSSFKRGTTRDHSVEAAATLASLEHQRTPGGGTYGGYARFAALGQQRPSRDVYASMATFGLEKSPRGTYGSYGSLAPAPNYHRLAREYGSHDRLASIDRLIALKQEELRIRAELASYESEILEMNRRKYGRYSEGEPSSASAPLYSSKEERYRSLLGPGKGVCHLTSDSRLPLGEPKRNSPAFNRAA